MTDIFLCYITCESVDQAQNIGKELLNQRLAGCINIYLDMNSMFFWPPKSGEIDQNHEVVLIAKTLQSKYKQLEAAVIRLHSFDTPCIIAIPTAAVSAKYYDWLVGEMQSGK